MLALKWVGLDARTEHVSTATLTRNMYRPRRSPEICIDRRAHTEYVSTAALNPKNALKEQHKTARG